MDSTPTAKHDPGPPSGRLDRIVDWLAARGATPNHVSWGGFACGLVAAACLAAGASSAVWPFDFASQTAPTGAWTLAAAFFIVASSAGDILDGRLARRHDLATPYGGLLDSVLDRFADMALFGGCALHFAAQGNLTYVLLALLGIGAAVQTSYAKARGESMTKGLDVGFWQRGERISCLLVGALTGHMATSLWLLATFPYLTVLRRMRAARRGLETGAVDPAPRPWEIWKQSRRTMTYRVFVTLIILFIAFSSALLPFFGAQTDYVGRWLGAS